MNDIFYKCIALVFSLMILGNAFVIKRWVGTWLFPAGIFSLFWFMYTFFPLLFMFTVPINPWSVIFIWCCSLVFSLSTILFNWKRVFRRNSLKDGADKYFNTRFLFITFYIFSFFSLPFFYLSMLSHGFSIHDMFFNIFETAGKYAQMRYTQAIEPNTYIKLSLVFSYLSITIGGLIFGVEKSKGKRVFILMIAFLPAIATMLFQSNKGLFFLFVALFFAGVMVTRIFNNYFYIFDKATVKVALLSLLVVVPAVVVSLLARGLYSSGDSDYILQKLTSYICTYAFAHLYAFSDWFTFAMGGRSVNNYSAQDLSFGFHTFTSFFKVLGDTREVPLGHYDEHYQYKELLKSNIYTIFRGLIMDFGVGGSILFMFISGMFLHLSFYCMLYYRKPVISVVLFMFMVGYFYITFIISIFVWNIIPLSMVLLSFILLLNKYKLKI
ncbi:MAG: O-antigen polymerase [Methylococcaceae bacterium]